MYHTYGAEAVSFMFTIVADSSHEQLVIPAAPELAKPLEACVYVNVVVDGTVVITHPVPQLDPDGVELKLELYAATVAPLMNTVWPAEKLCG